MKTKTESLLPLEDSTGPGFGERMARRVVLSMLERFDHDPIHLDLPDGTALTVGNPLSGKEPALLQIHNHAFFSRVLLHGEIGFGEAYMEGHWSTPDLPGLISALIMNLEHIPGMSGSRASAIAFNCLRGFNWLAHWRRRNTRHNSARNIREHYDLSNDFYALWLDETLTYSSAWFKGDEPLESAQEHKYQRLCERLRLAPGMRVLEIGCGWGGFSIHAARHFGVHMTAITISQAQFDRATERVREQGLEDKVEVLLCDYRDVQGSFDAIVSIEMLEAVGHEFLKTFFDQCHRVLKPEGRLGLQVIVCPDSRYDAMRRSADWIKKYIFPGGQLPSIKALVDSANATGDLYLHYLENFGLHYARTLQLWRDKFNHRREAVLSMGFDERFVRKWNYYLAYCEAAFATRNINVTQMVLSRPNNTAFVIE